MSEQPEAVKLAEKLEGYSPNSGYAELAGFGMSADAELRRLLEVNMELINQLDTIALFAAGQGNACELINKRARAAIAKAEGEKA